MTLIVTWLWQGLAIACFTALALRAIPWLNAATRHVIWWLALTAVLAIPVVHLVVNLHETRSVPDIVRFGPVETGMLVLPALPAPVLTGVTILWALTLAFGLVRVVRSYREVGRLKGASVLFDLAREERLTMWVTARDSSRRNPVLRTSDSRAGACALGLGRPPVVLISGALADLLSDDQLDEIVMHEQAHLERRDDWLKLLQAIVNSVAGLHPALRFIMRQIDADCEAACDDRVVARTGDARRYAWTLAAAASTTVQTGRVGLCPSAAGKASALRRRVDRLLDPRRDRNAGVATWTSVTSATVLAMAVAGAAQVTPIVSFVEAAEAMLPHAVAPRSFVSQVTEATSDSTGPAVVEGSTAIARSTPTRRRTAPPALAVAPTLPIESLPNLFRDEQPTAPSAWLIESLPSRPVGAEGAALLPSGAPAVRPTTDRTMIAIESVLPWSEVAATATATAVDAARAASSTGVQVGNIGTSFGDFMTRVAKRF
jgi:beta-lactamase regulating signal transducer with metallopeptidase domain